MAHKWSEIKHKNPPEVRAQTRQEALAELDRMTGMEIDETVRDVVAALNKVPGVETYSSCGGHEVIEHSCQMREGWFFVAFNVDPKFIHSALTLIAYVAGRVPGLTLQVWYNGWLNQPCDSECLSFQLKGTSKANRNLLVNELTTVTGG